MLFSQAIKLISAEPEPVWTHSFSEELNEGDWIET